MTEGKRESECQRSIRLAKERQACIEALEAENNGLKQKNSDLQRQLERVNTAGNDALPLPGVEIIAELPADMSVMLATDGDDPAFLIAGIRGNYGGLYLVMRDDTGNPRETCPEKDEPQSVRNWRKLGYRSEVVFGQTMLMDRIAWYQQLEESQISA